MKVLGRKILMALGGAALLMSAGPASAYYVVEYRANGQVYGWAIYCDNGNLWFAEGSRIGQPHVVGSVPGGDATVPC